MVLRSVPDGSTGGSCRSVSRPTNFLKVLQTGFEVERFDRVVVGPDRALLRVAGRWHADRRVRLTPPTLLLDDGRRRHRLPALPGPDDVAPSAGPDAPPWRSAFSVPADLLLPGRQITFALETEGGIVDLPHPREVSLRTATRGGDGAIAPDAEHRSRQQADRTAQQHRQELLELEARLSAERAARGDAQTAAHEARDALKRVRAETAAALQTRERRAQELADRLAFLEQAQATADAAAQAARRELAAVQTRLDERVAAEHTTRQQFEAALIAREHELQVARAHAQQTASEVAEWADTARAEVEADVARARTEVQKARTEARQAIEDAQAARDEAAAAQQRAEALEFRLREEARVALERAHVAAREESELAVRHAHAAAEHAAEELRAQAEQVRGEAEQVLEQSVHAQQAQARAAREELRVAQEAQQAEVAEHRAALRSAAAAEAEIAGELELAHARAEELERARDAALTLAEQRAVGQGETETAAVAAQQAAEQAIARAQQAEQALQAARQTADEATVLAQTAAERTDQAEAQIATIERDLDVVRAAMADTQRELDTERERGRGLEADARRIAAEAQQVNTAASERDRVALDRARGLERRAVAAEERCDELERRTAKLSDACARAATSDEELKAQIAALKQRASTEWLALLEERDDLRAALKRETVAHRRAAQRARRASRELAAAGRAPEKTGERRDVEAGSEPVSRRVAETVAEPPAVAEPGGRITFADAVADRVRGLAAARRRRDQPHPSASDRRARIFVWTCWGLALASSAALVLLAGRNVPIQEDWHVIAAATGHQEGFWAWVWEPNNEHRVPIAKLLYVALFQLWPDFRVGMVFNVAALAGIAAAFVVFLRRMRGHTRWTDAFFPLIFLHLGNWENFGWSWQLTFVIAAGVATAILMLLAAGGPWTTRRASLLVGCLVLTPFTGATALPFAAAVAAALLLESRRVAGRPRTVLATGGVLTLVLSGLYFIGLPEVHWVPESPGLTADVLTSGKFLALGLGPAAAAWWLVSILAVSVALASAAWLLWRARRQGTLTLLAFLAAGVALAASLGSGRAGAVPFYGMPDRYVLVAIPVLCAIYIVWEQYGVRARRIGPAGLCCTMLLLLPLNTIYGAEWKDWYHERVDTFAADVEDGIPLAQLIRYRPLGQDAAEMGRGLVYMRQHDIGIFDRVRLIPPPVRAWAIDGFASGGAGWETLRGRESRARLVTRKGHREMRWEYAATSSAPAVLGRHFDEPADWRGAGALAFTITGQGSQRRVRVRLTVDAPAGGVERFDTWFTDTTADTKTLVVPWNGFGRANVRGEFVEVLKGPLPLTGVRSVTFIIGDTGPGVLRLKRLALTPGHPQLGWPLHSAAERPSLPPWN